MKKFFALAAIIIFLPIAFTIIFGIVYSTNTVKKIPLTIYDEDQTSTSRTLIEMYTDSDRFTFISQVNTNEQMSDEIFTGRAKVALVIPKNFSNDIKLGNGTEILLVVDSENNMFGNAALSASQEINRTFTVGVAQKLLEGSNLLPSAAMSAVYPIRMGVRILGNPTAGYSQFMLGGLLLNGSQLGMMIAFAPFLFDQMRRRKFSDVPKILLEAIPYWLCGMFGYIVSLMISVNFFVIPMKGSWLDAIILGGAFLFFVQGVLMIFSSVAPTREMSLQSPMLYIMPGLLYSGLSFPLFDMNDTAEFFSLLLPMTYAGDTLRDIMLLGYAPTLWRNCGIMLLGGIIGIFIALIIFRMKEGFRRERDLPT